MILFWRGWGISVFFLLMFWLLAMIVVVVASDVYLPDPHQAAISVQWLFTGMFFAYTLSVYAVARYRWNHPLLIVDPETKIGVSVPHVDDLYGIRLDFWPYILGFITALLAILTGIGYEIF